jgi:hypothetical protein
MNDSKRNPLADDIGVIHAFLGGFLDTDRRGLPRTSYMKKDSSDDIYARQAIARILRSYYHLPRQMREELAALFDTCPDTYPSVKRRIVFEFRGRGIQRNDRRNSLIATQVYEAARAGASINKAVDGVCDRYSLTREYVMRVWSRYRSFLIEMGGPLPRASRSHRRPAAST